MADTKIDAAKIAKLLEVARDLQDKVGETLDEIEALLGGRAGIGGGMKTIREAFDAGWTERYKSKFVWRGAAESPDLKRFVKDVGVDETSARVGRFFADSDPYLQLKRHAFYLFADRFNSYAAEPKFFDVPVNGCTHVPRCRSDAEHTRARAQELRA